MKKVAVVNPRFTNGCADLAMHMNCCHENTHKDPQSFPESGSQLKAILPANPNRTHFTLSTSNADILVGRFRGIPAS